MATVAQKGSFQPHMLSCYKSLKSKNIALAPLVRGANSCLYTNTGKTEKSVSTSRNRDRPAPALCARMSLKPVCGSFMLLFKCRLSFFLKQGDIWNVPRLESLFTALWKVSFWEGFLTPCNQNRTVNALTSQLFSPLHFRSGSCLWSCATHQPPSVYWFLGGFRFKLIFLKSHSSLYPWKLTKIQGVHSVLLNENEKFLETVIIKDLIWQKRRKKRSHSHQNIYWKQMCLAKLCREILSNPAGSLGIWGICFMLDSTEHPGVWHVGVQIQSGNGLPMRSTCSAFCFMQVSKYLLRHWVEILGCSCTYSSLICQYCPHSEWLENSSFPCCPIPHFPAVLAGMA